MRELKFRIWDKINKVITTNVILNPLWISLFKDNDLYYLDLIGDKNYGSNIIQNKCLDLIIDQFTELYDKNNKEIFENDIVLIKNIDGECTGENIIGVIAFTHGHFYIHDNISDDNLSDFCINGTEKVDLEIIGNIHENPELLKYPDLLK